MKKKVLYSAAALLGMAMIGILLGSFDRTTSLRPAPEQTVSPAPQTQSKRLSEVPHDPNAFVVFKKLAGPKTCPSLELCATERLILYSSGRLDISGTEVGVEQSVVTEVIKMINAFNLMRKNCAAPERTDQQIVYVVSTDGPQNILRYPGCDQELGQIEYFIRVSAQ